MKTIDFSYFIERYNAGEMDHVERKWFEKELNGSDTLRKEVNLRKRVDNSLIQHDLISLRNKLAILEKTRKEKAAAASGKKAVGIRFAAAIAALLAIGTIYMLISGSSDPETLFKKNYEAYSLNSNSRSLEKGQMAELNTAFQLYREMNYAGAASILNDYLKNHPANTETWFVYGASEMNNYNYPDAKSAFGKVINHNDNLYLDKAQWYLALCSIKTDDKAEAIRQLDAIKKSESIYKVKARRLLRKIK